VDGTAPTGPGVARAVAAALPAGSLLTVGASALIRDLDWAEPRRGVGGPLGGPPGGDGGPPVVLANRGLAGIDGTVSTAVGAALAHQAAHPGRPAYALLGDLAFLHDANGLLLGPDETRPDLTLVVVNDDGGGIFHTLEQGAPPYAAAFERVFATPHGVDLGALCAATRTPHVVVGSLGALRAELASAGRGLRVVEVRIGRAGRRELSGQLTATARAAIRGVLTGQG
jgi:2-succinyl-5-enolpyruvyl-6-hydroxy-3-cyclohexene-1-carboxylate synthase